MKIRFDNVSYAYEKNKCVLKDIDLEFNKNEIVFVLGATGSGKSTLISHINGLLFASKGNVIIENDGKSYTLNNKLKNIKEVRRNIGMVFQIPENQIFESTVLKEVMFASENFDIDLDLAERCSFEALKLLNLDEGFYNKSPFKLSGGEKRKVAIASILSYNPKVLIFDEPTSSLDNKSIRDFFSIINKLKSDGNMVIVISHNEDLAYEYADRVIIMDKGSVLYDGDYSDAFNDEEILSTAKIGKPFVCKMKEKLNIDSDCRTIKELANVLRGDTL